MTDKRKDKDTNREDARDLLDWLLDAKRIDKADYKILLDAVLSEGE